MGAVMRFSEVKTSARLTIGPTLFRHVFASHVSLLIGFALTSIIKKTHPRKRLDQWTKSTFMAGVPRYVLSVFLPHVGDLNIIRNCLLYYDNLFYRESSQHCAVRITSSVVNLCCSLYTTWEEFRLLNCGCMKVEFKVLIVSVSFRYM